jgi:hypothetical protein
MFHIDSTSSGNPARATLVDIAGGRLRGVGVKFEPSLSVADVVPDISNDTFQQTQISQQLCPQRQSNLASISEIEAAITRFPDFATEVQIASGMVRFLGPPGPFGQRSARLVALSTGQVATEVTTEHMVGLPARSAILSAGARASGAKLFALGEDGSIVVDQTFFRSDGRRFDLISLPDFKTRIRDASQILPIETLNMNDDALMANTYDLLRVALVTSTNITLPGLKERNLLQSPLVYLAR